MAILQTKHHCQKTTVVLLKLNMGGRIRENNGFASLESFKID